MLVPPRPLVNTQTEWKATRGVDHPNMKLGLREASEMSASERHPVPEAKGRPEKREKDRSIPSNSSNRDAFRRFGGKGGGTKRDERDGVRT